MYYCAIEIKNQTATFRNPEFQNFHKSFELPPPTTLIGLVGAALGLSPKAAQHYCETSISQIGVYGRNLGYTKDLWKYRTLEDKNPTSILKKEILFDNHFVVVYGSDNKAKMLDLEQAFLNPFYALSMGSNDSLAKVVSTKQISETQHKKVISHCLVAGDIVGEVLKNAGNGLSFSMYSTSEPITYDLPIQFNYTSDYGMRNVTKRQTLSFIGEPFELNINKEGVAYQPKDNALSEVFIPVFPINF